jgi:glutaminyl-peptide cyclotransferase
MNALPPRIRLGLLALALTALLISALSACRAQEAQRLTVEVIATTPHDPQAFTQGLLLDGAVFLESTGLYGRSDLREVDRRTGAVIRARPLANRYFGEGLAQVGSRLIQLTYREGVAFVYDRASFEEIERFSYAGEGWGLCYDGTWLWMSDGSATLTRRDAATFAVTERVTVRRDGTPIERLNELACAEGKIVANVWLTNELVRIDPSSGRVEATIDASALVPSDPRLRANPDAVLNGVAYDEATGHYFLTGKLWPTMYEVRFVPAANR